MLERIGGIGGTRDAFDNYTRSLQQSATKSNSWGSHKGNPAATEDAAAAAAAQMCQGNNKGSRNNSAHNRCKMLKTFGESAKQQNK